MTLTGDGSTDDGSGGCSAADGLTDIATGSEVDVLDASGKVLAVGALEAGTNAATGCEFDFTVTGVPNDESIYGVKVGNQARGVVHFSKAQMFGAGPQLTIG